MQRRHLFHGALGAYAITGGAWTAAGQSPPPGSPPAEPVIERDRPGQPHKGKVLAAIQPHSDDIPIFAAGLTAKLIAEGYTGYLIRTTNDEAAGPGTIGECIHANERDNFAVARALGLKEAYDLYGRNHRLDAESIIELRARFIFLIRALKIDTIICYDPWGHYEENPDHYVTAAAVEAACWMAGMSKDYPEHFIAGLKPHLVREKYYFARGPQLVNRVVDIGSHIEKKIDSMVANKAQGPAGERGSRLRASLAERKLRLPVLGDNDESANREYIRHFLMKREEETGRRYGLRYAEPYHYIGFTSTATEMDDYIRKNAVPLG